ncbi:glycosyltransferase family 2 protein [Primorskyibacter sp. S87]|uniref:glycosyltransferase family 2 protein n=1 Tax=Primorskyibacter sp. S87 TaxID=3415126 RepID=UPI003C7BA683
MTKWGLVATVKAPVQDILTFAAHHIELGAHRIYIYLDEDHAEARAALTAHPKVRVTLCDEAYWQKRRGQRPRKHQSRQAANATHAYRRKAEIDWLIHLDVDEFLWPDASVAGQLASLPDHARVARVRPVEALAGDDPAFKAFIPPGPERDRIVSRLYPRFGHFVKGGFMSHVAGKIFVRTGLDAIQLRIHDAFQKGERLPTDMELGWARLCHFHGDDWDHWIAAYRFRLEQGAYRDGLAAARPDGPTLFAALTHIEQTEGEAGLRAFFDEINATSEIARKALKNEGMLLQHDLHLERSLRRQFPNFL